MTDRFVPHFQDELEQLKTRLLEMGGLAEERVRTVLRALVERDPALVERVIAGDVRCLPRSRDRPRELDG